MCFSSENGSKKIETRAKTSFLIRDAGKKVGQGGQTGAKGHLLP